ncbi:layilin isoform X2 [Mastacembelus armatus]|uniref:layilin isoform X2 n=1 Tax=Mastacembelus armatus TaxID=205130 RepID=UPI001436C468|nr:layilin-like isoform X2 [Mastacembelus armatus]
MDFMKLFGTVIAVLFHPGSASKIHGQRICRQGTQRPCYKVSYIQDSRRRVTFEDASQACRLDGGELLSIETESEQRMIESFIKQLQTGDGDFWIGLRRSPQHHRTGATRPGCPSQYYWLDGSKAKFRNWLWDEPSCDGEMCVVLYHQPSAPPDEGHFLFQWNDANCTSKNNFVCKYPEGKVPVFTQEGKTAHAGTTYTELPHRYCAVCMTFSSDSEARVIRVISICLRQHPACFLHPLCNHSCSAAAALCSCWVPRLQTACQEEKDRNRDLSQQIKNMDVNNSFNMPNTRTICL